MARAFMRLTPDSKHVAQGHHPPHAHLPMPLSTEYFKFSRHSVIHPCKSRTDKQHMDSESFGISQGPQLLDRDKITILLDGID